MISQKVNNKSQIMFISMASGLEYFDFVLYGFLATYIGSQFFPENSGHFHLLQGLLIFSIGYIVRPISGFILGSLGDRFGRKPVFLASVSLTGITTLCIGALPTYAMWGSLSTVLLIILRILQGVAFSADLPGAATIVLEQYQQQRGLYTGLVLRGVSLSVLLCIVSISAITWALTAQQMSSFGWRIPFFIGGGLACIGYFVRRKLYQANSVSSEKINIAGNCSHLHSPGRPSMAALTRGRVVTIAEKLSPTMLSLFTTHYQAIVQGVLLLLLPSCLVIFLVSLPSYLHSVFKDDMSMVFRCAALGYLWSAITLPAAGALGDRVGQIKLYRVSLIAIVIAFPFLFMLLMWHSVLSLLAFFLICHVFISVMATSYLPLLGQLFPSERRYAGTGFVYNACYALASMLPYFISVTGIVDTKMLSILFSCLAALTFMAASSIRSHSSDIRNCPYGQSPGRQ